MRSRGRQVPPPREPQPQPPNEVGSNGFLFWWNGTQRVYVVDAGGGAGVDFAFGGFDEDFATRFKAAGMSLEGVAMLRAICADCFTKDGREVVHHWETKGYPKKIALSY